MLGTRVQPSSTSLSLWRKVETHSYRWKWSRLPSGYTEEQALMDFCTLSAFSISLAQREYDAQSRVSLPGGCWARCQWDTGTKLAGHGALALLGSPASFLGFPTFFLSSFWDASVMQLIDSRENRGERREDKNK